MNSAETLIAVSTLMLEAAAHEDWSSVAALDGERRSLIHALPTALDPETVRRLQSLDTQLLSMACAERTRLGERVRVGQKLDQAAKQYAVAARSDTSRTNGAQ